MHLARCFLLFLVLPCDIFVQARSQQGIVLGHKKDGLHNRLAALNQLQFPGKCQEKFKDSYVDHFSWMQADSEFLTYKHRYFICDEYWKPDANGMPGPIFFYTGNEAPVTLYVNATGLMWEWAPELGALLIFAEHRYYGESIPLPFFEDVTNLQYFSTEQAMADYAHLIFQIKEELNCRDSPVIGFGGSYGGMLSSWMRMKYPAALTGAVAGSAPIWTYFGEIPPVNPDGFAAIQTFDATPAAGSSAACVDNVRNVWKTMEKMADSAKGLSSMSEIFSLCLSSVLKSFDDYYNLRDWTSSALAFMAMGNYPYASSYMTNGDGYLPAYPMRVMCEYLKEADMSGSELLSAFAKSVGLFYNATKDKECYDLNGSVNNETAVIGYLWDFQFCTEQFQPQSTNGVDDMFWQEPFDFNGTMAWCKYLYGINPRPYHAQVQWGGKQIQAASNIIFSNGEYDPWRYGGITTNLSDSLIAIVIPEVGHHCDLYFSNPEDPPGLTAARLQEKAIVKKWIQDAYGPPPSEIQEL
eukprot:TRINITY_DN468_c0_g1_i5.p1 TRINITY_DN468_c0_g1~~TRINITY_DN468_c0_g1_i5.p1  ORF type:complete len:541 (-),score=89.95 TRINITY_DN468_c0_g1_i5:247-1818(-)